ncbi:uncharacterized protein HaLaN_10645, partial [Haematococcus lacustris]
MATEVENEAQLPEIAKEEEKIAPHHDSNTKYRKGTAGHHATTTIIPSSWLTTLSSCVLVDYKAPPFSIQTVDLDFILNEDVTQVHSTLTLVPQYPEGSAPPALVLNGRADVTLASLKVNGSDWPAEHTVSQMATEVENEAQLPEIAKEEEKIAPHHDSNTKYRKDYKAPPFSIQTVDLDFILNEDVTQVHSTLTLVPQYPEGSAPPALVLNGRADVTLASLKVNGSDWPAEQYSRSDKELQITGLPAGPLTLAITTHIKPQENSLLEGLYKSGGNYCTQVSCRHPPPEAVQPLPACDARGSNADPSS